VFDLGFELPVGVTERVRLFRCPVGERPKNSTPIDFSCTMTKKKQRIVHGQKTLSGFAGVQEPAVEEQADVSRTRNALTFNDNWLKDLQN
jgi:hypothetical protein